MFIHLDPRRPDVLVPKGFLGQHQLVLQVGLNMAIPIPDLTIDDAGIACTLSFSRTPFWCRIPWSAVYALVGEDGRGGVWPEDVPPEIQQQKQGSAPKGAGAKRPRPKLAAVGSAKEETPEPEAAREAPAQVEEAPVAPPPRALSAVPREMPRETTREPAAQGPRAAEASAPSTPSSPPAAGKKPKREIPPYLRVIK